MKITWNTDVNAPCCPGEIVAEDGRTILCQTDTDYPGIAGTFGFSVRYVHDPADMGCIHDGTDGTIDCPNCIMKASQFIAAAYSWLIDHDGATADDPGYFA